MKKLYSLFALMIASSIAFAQYNYVTIKLNGETVSYPIGEVDFIEFTQDNQTATADYELRVLTFEDADYVGSEPLGYWSSLIGDTPYGGNLYSGNFEWYDEGNTELGSAITVSYKFSSGGEAISKYINNNYATELIGYTEQLSAPNGGHNGSVNFGIHYGYVDDWGMYEGSGLTFYDGTPRVIDHLYIELNSYALSYIYKDYALKNTDWVKIIATGTDIDGNEKTTEIMVVEDGKAVESWIKWDLSSLGEIINVNFDMKGTISNDWGFSFPAYFAYDNIAVRFPKN